MAQFVFVRIERYHTGPKLHANDIKINQLVKRYCPNSVMVIIDARPKGLGLPTDAYYQVDEIHDDGTPATKTFAHLASEMGAEEAEEVGVEHLLRDIKDTAVGTLSQKIGGQLIGLKGLQSKLHDITVYLEQVATDKLPINHQIVYLLQDVFNLLPDVHLESFVNSVFVRTNDQMLVIYIASMVRAIIALHNLILNKVSLRDAEKENAKTVKEKRKDAGDTKTDKPTAAADAK